MNNYALSAMAMCFALTSSFGKIINGYDREIQTARASFQHLNKLPQQGNVLQRLEAVKEMILYHELTRTLLSQFQHISPTLYEQINTISDHYGRQVDVYVKFVPRSSILIGTLGNTNLNQKEDDEHAYVSRYGSNTVAVEILIVKHSLQILAHEFGHIGYQVPNLSRYVAFFKRNYTDRQLRSDYLGHKPNDLSGQNATVFEQQFKKDLCVYARSNDREIFNPMVLRQEIRKTI